MWKSIDDAERQNGVLCWTSVHALGCWRGVTGMEGAMPLQNRRLRAGQATSGPLPRRLLGPEIPARLGLAWPPAYAYLQN